jgi:hypothetical protein
MEITETRRGEAFLALLEGMRDPALIQAYLERSDFRRATLQSVAFAVVGATFFGVWTGFYAMTFEQLGASALKAPVLLVGTTVVCFPAFFVVQYVLAPRALSLRGAVLLQASTLAIIAITWSVVALPCSLFIANAQSYVATKFLVTAVAGFGGVIGMGWFVRGYRSATSSEQRRGSLLPLVPYCVLFAFVGAQVAWSLRPFIGSPNRPFSFFREGGGNLLEDLLFSL